MNILMMIISALVMLGVLVSIHEFGHYWAARVLGVKVLVYSIGFGPQIIKWQSPKTGIIYQLAALPLGGYVKMLDEREKDSPILEQDLDKAFNRQSVWKRFLIVFAGPAINLLFAVFIFWILYLPASEQLNTRIDTVVPDTPAYMQLKQKDQILAIDHKNVDTWEQIHFALVNRMGESGSIQFKIERDHQIHDIQLPITHFLNNPSQSPLEVLGFYPYRPPMKAVIAEVLDNGAAQKQGLKAGDEILKIDGKNVKDWYDVVTIIRHSPEKMLQMEVLRQGNILLLPVMPQAKRENGQVYGSIGVKPHLTSFEIPSEYKKTIQYSPLQALEKAIIKTYDMSCMIVSSIVKMIKGWIGIDNLSGPISIAKGAGQSAEMGWQYFLYFMAMISVSLGILNLLPIPILDGGHLVYYIIEAVRGKPVSESMQMMGLKIGMILLVSMTLLALFNDLMRL